MIYLSHAAGAQVVRDAADLAARLALGRPALLVLSRDQDLSSLPALHPGSHRVDERYNTRTTPYTMWRSQTGPLLAPTLRPGESEPCTLVRSGSGAHAHPVSHPGRPAEPNGFAGGTFVSGYGPARHRPLTMLVRSQTATPPRCGAW
jgi:hypothetical protein